jgi:hypothetical protein
MFVDPGLKPPYLENKRPLEEWIAIRVQEQPTDSGIRICYAASLDSQGKWQEARHQYDEAIRLLETDSYAFTRYPERREEQRCIDRALARFAKGLIYWERRQKSAARSEWSQAKDSLEAGLTRDARSIRSVG